MAEKMSINLAEMDEDVDMDVDEELEEVEEPKKTDTADGEKNEAQEKDDEKSKSTKKATVAPKISLLDLPENTRKDKSLKEVLDMMEGDYAPIIPDAVTDYYLARNGLQVTDLKIKRILALATQKFISDIATDAYEYSRIRSSSAVYNSNNPQARARALVSGQPIGGGSGAGSKQEKIILTSDDLSNALSEYGLNINRPDFYR